MTNFLTQYINPYADEAREWANRYHTDGRAYLERIIAHLDAIVDAINDDDWDEGRVKINATFADVSQVWELDGDGLTVPMGTEWVLETCSPIMVVGSATFILRVNGRYRVAGSVGVNGTTTVGALTANGIHLAQGDHVQIETTGMTAGEIMDIYLQFRSRKIRSRRARNAGQPVDTTDKPNDAGATLARSAPVGITQTAPVIGDATTRANNEPPALPYVR